MLFRRLVPVLLLGYEFFFIASPRTDGGPGFATVADIHGAISNAGSSK